MKSKKDEKAVEVMAKAMQRLVGWQSGELMKVQELWQKGGGDEVARNKGIQG